MRFVLGWVQQNSIQRLMYCKEVMVILKFSLHSQTPPGVPPRELSARENLNLNLNTHPLETHSWLLEYPLCGGRQPVVFVTVQTVCGTGNTETIITN